VNHFNVHLQQMMDGGQTLKMDKERASYPQRYC